MKKILYLLLFSFVLITYGEAQEECLNIKIANDSLGSEIEELNAKFEENKTIDIVEKAYFKKDFLTAKANIKILKEKYPESPKNREFQQLLLSIEQKEKEEEDQLRKEMDQFRKETEAAEVTLKNLNTGIWTIKYYVDNFGEPTKDGYITTSNVIKGVFSNIATQNSSLNVYFIITSSVDIDIQLFEYAGNNPVKAYSPDKYNILLQDGSKNRTLLRATNYSDRLSFDNISSLELHYILMKGGVIKFRITEDKTPTTVYSFDIVTADWYENAYHKLTKKYIRNKENKK